MEIAKKDLLMMGSRGVLGKPSLTRFPFLDLRFGSGNGSHLASSLELSTDPLGDQGDDDQRCYDQCSERKQEEAGDLSKQGRTPFRLAWCSWYPAEDPGYRCSSGNRGKT